jgi:hypothetical protein
MKPIGRLLVRENDIAGVFIPYKDQTSLKPGIYEITSILDEIIIRYVGISSVHEKRVNGLDLSELLLDAPNIFLTEAEVKRVLTNE